MEDFIVAAFACLARGRTENDNSTNSNLKKRNWNQNSIIIYSKGKKEKNSNFKVVLEIIVQGYSDVDWFLFGNNSKKECSTICLSLT